jgi:hypothetical protein
MSACRVTSVRASALTACLTLLLAGPVAASGPDLTGGAVFPGSSLPEPPESAAPSSVPAAGNPPVSTTPATPASTITEATLPLAAPPLSTPLRRVSDPTTADLAGLQQPSAIAAIDGHAVIVRQRGGRSELVDITAPGAAPRILLSSTRAFGVPNAGRDGTGHPVVVVSPCAGADEVVLQHRAPNCPLRAIDLTDGVSRAVPGSAGALQGDIAGDAIVFARRSPRVGARLYLRSSAGVRPVALPPLGPASPEWPTGVGAPVAGSLAAGGIDLSADGRIAVVMDHRAAAPRFASTLWVRSAAGAWHHAVSVSTPREDLGVRRVLGPQLDDAGVRAYVEGVVDGPSFVGHWTTEGQSTARFSIRRSIGRSTILRDAAYDGDRIVFVDWLPGLPCGSEGANACGLRAVGPISAG